MFSSATKHGQITLDVLFPCFLASDFQEYPSYPVFWGNLGLYLLEE